MKNIGLIGWRGLVGSVLIQRMLENNDFTHYSQLNIFFHCFSTSQVGKQSPSIANGCNTLLDAYSIEQLQQMDIIICCQGSDYTKQVYSKLCDSGWSGYWVDSSSHLRMHQDATLILDPVNYQAITQAISDNRKLFIGANCTVSLMLMAINGLLKQDLVEWINPATYQAVSGAGAKAMRNLLQQMGGLYNHVNSDLQNVASSILDIDKKINHWSATSNDPANLFASNVIPFIDSMTANGQTREEYKAEVEANKILNSNQHIAIDGLCARVGAMRCHSQALTIKLKKNLSLATIEELLADSHEWIDIIANDAVATKKQLTPLATSGTLRVKIGRIRKLTLGNDYLSLFTVADQLLWGAAEPLRRLLNILVKAT
jgi:aspartate-semialdehyde dehydrogenase